MMVAYDYYCKQRLLDWYKRKSQKPQFSEEEVLNALTSIHSAMAMATDIAQEAEVVHMRSFKQQLEQWGFDEKALPKEPYLEEVIMNFSHSFVRSMDALFTRVESYLHNIKAADLTSVISFYSGDSKEMHSLDKAMEWKSFITKEPLAAQVNARIMQEAAKAQQRLQRNLDARRQTLIGIDEYIWRSVGDDEVRDAHAHYNNQVFRWDSPPADGHPGQAYGCRCSAEAHKPLELSIFDPLIEPVYPELLFIGIGRAAWVSARVAVQGIRNTIKKVAEQIGRLQTDRLFRRPEGVPKDWIRRPSRKNEGMRYTKPETKGADEVRIMRGRLDTPHKISQKPYVRWKKNGRWLDKNGKTVNRDDLEGHIPLHDFKFKQELFK